LLRLLLPLNDLV